MPEKVPSTTNIKALKCVCRLLFCGTLWGVLRFIIGAVRTLDKIEIALLVPSKIAVRALNGHLTFKLKVVQKHYRLIHYNGNSREHWLWLQNFIRLPLMTSFAFRVILSIVLDLWACRWLECFVALHTRRKQDQFTS